MDNAGIWGSDSLQVFYCIFLYLLDGAPQVFFNILVATWTLNCWSQEEQQLRCSQITYNTAISACERGEQWEWALHLLRESQEHQLFGDLITYNAGHLDGRSRKRCLMVNRRTQFAWYFSSWRLDHWGDTDEHDELVGLSFVCFVS